MMAVIKLFTLYALTAIASLCVCDFIYQNFVGK